MGWLIAGSVDWVGVGKSLGNLLASPMGPPEVLNLRVGVPSFRLFGRGYAVATVELLGVRKSPRPCSKRYNLLLVAPRLGLPVE
jgi:hypothetical protein